MGREACSYFARVRIRVRVGDIIVCRESSGSGHGIANIPGEAHESALKEAETDAMKRALATFGNPFGLALYDKDRRGARGTIPAQKETHVVDLRSWTLISPDGQTLSTHIEPRNYRSAVKQILESHSKIERLVRFWDQNAATVGSLRSAFPVLTSDKGVHFADILQSLYRQRYRALEEKDNRPAPPTATADQGSISKADLAIRAPQRLRDKDHLRRVGALPCLVCGRTPSQSHHLRFTQPWALGRKVSDEWVVPLCATHHRALHDACSEEEWWKRRGINPVREAERLWSESRQPHNDAMNAVSRT